MIIEIISTGTELLLGQIVNTNAPYLARRLNELGFDVLFQSTVGDNRERMTQVLSVALARADVIITTGGLGPTQGDITKEVTAALLGRKLYLHEPSLDHIKCFFTRRNLNMSDNNLRQAMIAEGALVLKNSFGLAPGTVVETEKNTVIHLPGPPYEMEGMFEQEVAPYLIQRFGDQGVIFSKTLRSFGLGESALEEEIKDLIKAQNNPTIALLVRGGEITVRITAKASDQQSAQKLIDDMEQKIRSRIDKYVFGINDETQELVTGRLLAAKKLTVALAESCTGGLVTNRLTDIPGSSEYLTGSVVCYSNAAKISAVGVPASTLEEFGAVSSQAAQAMASGIRNLFASDIGIGITGIAGPGGATDDKPVGLVFIALADKKAMQCHQYNFIGDRMAIKQRTANTALSLIRQHINAL